MIRDEFIKQQKDKKLSSKELQKIRAVGERAFYTNQINRITNYSKALNFSFIIVAVLLAIVAIPLFIVWINGGTFTSEDTFSIVAVIVMLVMLITWFCIVFPIEKSKVKRYRKALLIITEKESQRQKVIFKNYIK